MRAIFQALRLIALTALPAALSCAPGAPPTGGPPERMVLIVVDTLRRDHIGHYGGATPTPHMDALAARGVAVEAQASFHQTTMSMGAMFTGRVPSLESGRPKNPLAWRPSTWCGMARFIDEIGKDECLPPRLRTLGESLEDAGYLGVGIVANSLLFRPAGFHRGFAVWTEIGARRAGKRPGLRARQRTAEFVHEALTTELDALSDVPRLFLYLHYTDVHDYRLLGIPYAEAVRRMDAALGELMRILEARDLLEGTVIVLTSDHGENLGESHIVKGMPNHGGNPSWGSVLDVPLIAVGVEAARLRPLMRTQNVYDLLVGVAGMQATPDEALASDELFVTERMFRTYRKGRYKSVWGRQDDTFRLLDLAADPGETRDVAAEQPAVVAEHRGRIEGLSRELAPESEFDTAAPIPDYMLERLEELGYLE